MPETDTNQLNSLTEELSSFVSVLNRFVEADELRNDGILRNNLLKLGAGSPRDVENFNTPDLDGRLHKNQLEDITFKESLGYRVASTMPALMAAGGVSLTGLEPDLLKKFNRALRKSKILKAFERATFLANIYDKGAAIVLAVDDGQPWNQPVNESRIKSVSAAFVESGYKILPQYLSGWIEPEYYQLSIDVTAQNEALSESVKALMQKGLSLVHKDRVLWFPGIWCPYDVETRYNGSPSRVSMFWRAYSRYELGLKLAVNLMARISVVVFHRKGLVDLLATTDKEAEAKLLREMELLQQSFNNMGMVFADIEKHKVEVITRSLAEVANLLGRLKQMTIAASGLTEVELFGSNETGGGLSNDDLRDRIIRANQVNAEQESQWREPMETYCRYQLLALNKSVEPDEWSLEFPNTLKLTPVEEIAELGQKINMGINLVTMQAMYPNELRKLAASHSVFAEVIDLEVESPSDKAEREAQEIEQPETEQIASEEEEEEVDH